MAWYWIVLIVIAALFVLTFTMYITNADMKLAAKIYDKSIARFDSEQKEEKL